MSKNNCYIVGAGTNYGLDFTVAVGDFVIAADGGFDHLHKQGITPDLSIGDFDSIAGKPTQGNIIALDKVKDHTDTFEAIQKGISLGYESFHIYCGTGGRFDHTFANIQALGFLSRNNKRGYLVGQDYVVTAITNSGIVFEPGCRGFISVFAYSDKATGVCIKGLKYELDDHCLTNTFPIGVSNEFTGVGSVISVENGTLAIIFPRECIAGVKSLDGL